MPTCLAANCDRIGVARGYCDMHYKRLYRHGDPESTQLLSRKGLCLVPDCSGRRYAKGYCCSHYMRLVRYGSPLAPLTRNPKGSGFLAPTGYRYRQVKGVLIAEHRAAWEAVNGPIPPGCIVHHINGDKLDNRIENLTVMTRGEHINHHRKSLKPNNIKLP